MGDPLPMVLIVCAALVLIALIAAITVSRWHEKELKKAAAEADKKAEREQVGLTEAARKCYIDALADCLKEQAKKGDKERQLYIDFLKEQAGLETGDNCKSEEK